MKATGSKLVLIEEIIDHSTGMKGEVYYDYERNLYPVLINSSLFSEHDTEDEAIEEMHSLLEI